MSEQSYNAAVGARIRILRQRNGVKQQTLAERLGVTESAISRFEQGERPITIATLMHIAELFQVAPSDLLPPVPWVTPRAASSPATPHAGTMIPPDLPPEAAGAIQSIVRVLTIQPERIIAVLDVLTAEPGDGAAG